MSSEKDHLEDDSERGLSVHHLALGAPPESCDESVFDSWSYPPLCTRRVKGDGRSFVSMVVAPAEGGAGSPQGFHTSQPRIDRGDGVGSPGIRLEEDGEDDSFGGF